MAFLDSHDDIQHDVYEIRLNITSTSVPGPQQVSGVTAALVSGDVQLTWNALTPLSRTDITGYSVYRALHGAGYASAHLQTTITPDPPAPSYSWSDPEAHDGSWDYWVIAENSAGYSPQSTPPAFLQGATSVLYTAGGTVDSLKPAQANADVTAQAGNVLLQNPTFIATLGGWGFGTGWSIKAFSALEASGPNSTLTSGGIFQAVSTTTSAISNNQLNPCSAGAVISATAWGSNLGSFSAGTACVRGTFYNASGTYLVSILGNSIASETGWQQSRVVATAPSGAAYFAIDFAVYNGTGAFGVTGFTASILANNIDEVPDGSTYLRMPGSNMDPNRRGLIDFGQGGHLGKNLDNILPGPSGTYASQKYYLGSIDSEVWVDLGTWTFANYGSTLGIRYFGGSGFNTGSAQQCTTTITVRSGNNGSAPNISGASWYSSGGTDALVSLAVCVAAGNGSGTGSSWNVYVQLNAFTNGYWEIAAAPGDTFTWAGGQVGPPPGAGPTCVYGTGGHVFNSGGTGLDAVNDGVNYLRILGSNVVDGAPAYPGGIPIVDLQPSQSGADVTLDHISTAYVTAPVQLLYANQSATAFSGLAWSVTIDTTSDVVNLFVTMNNALITTSGNSSGCTTTWSFCVDGNTSSPAWTKTLVLYNDSEGSTNIFLPLVASITGLSPGTHTVQLYLAISSISGELSTQGFGMAQLIY
jgi:hypothetical protein